MHGGGRNSAFLNSGGCSVAGAQVGCFTCRGKIIEGVGRLLLLARGSAGRLYFSSFCFDFF